VNEKRRGRGAALQGWAFEGDYFYFEKKIAEIDRMLSDPKLEETDRAC